MYVMMKIMTVRVIMLVAIVIKLSIIFPVINDSIRGIIASMLLVIRSIRLVLIASGNGFIYFSDSHSLSYSMKFNCIFGICLIFVFILLYIAAASMLVVNVVIKLIMGSIIFNVSIVNMFRAPILFVCCVRLIKLIMGTAIIVSTIPVVSVSIVIIMDKFNAKFNGLIYVKRVSSNFI